MSNQFNYIELFSGIGGFRSAFDPLGGNCVFASEIDSFATQSYRALYNGASELHGDITQIDAHDIPDHDVLVGGFPCQAFSVAGQRKGFEEARGTLFFEIARIASAKQPRLMLLENVKGLLSHDGGKTFDVMCAVLNDIGYAIDFRVLNSKHYGVPQNRERIFIVCDRDADHGDWTIVGNGVEAKAKRRAQDMWIRTFNFDWPTNDTVTTRLRDILEDNVDERYYLSAEKTAALVAQLEDRAEAYLLDTRQRNELRVYPDVAPTCTSTDYKEPKLVVEPQSSDDIKFVGMLGKGFRQINEVLDTSGVCTALERSQGGGLEPKIAVECVGNVNPSGIGMNGGVYDSNGLAPTLTTNKGEGTKVVEYSRKDGIGKELDVAHTLNSSDWRGLNRNQNAVLEDIRPVVTSDRPEKRQNGRRFKDDGEEPFTLTAQDKHGIAIGRYPRYRIRKLTPLECWRLQGFTDEQHETVKSAGISDSQRYKQAGNAVTVSVISAIAEKLCQRLPVTDDEFEAMLA